MLSKTQGSRVHMRVAHPDYGYYADCMDRLRPAVTPRPAD